MNDRFEGILLIDKPQGCTSHDVVARVRRVLQMKKVGHAGTLDPNATGLLIVLVGRATKVSQYLMSLPKVYEGAFTLGQVTDSHDSDGTVLETHAVPSLDAAQIQEQMNTFVGDQYQIPPMFSAKKIDGVPLYKLARKGQEVEREPRFISVSSYVLHTYEAPQGTFRVACSKGTYVRTLIHDLGKKIGCGAHLHALRRTATDHLSVDNAVTLDILEDMNVAEIRRRLIPVYQAVPSHVL